VLNRNQLKKLRHQNSVRQIFIGRGNFETVDTISNISKDLMME
jgi:hypothetical protein